MFLEKIILEFKTQKACAEAIDMNESAFSKLLKKPTPKFLAKLKSVGVVLNNEVHEPQIKYGNDGVQKLKDLIIDIQLKHKEELEEKDEKITELRVAIALANKRGRRGTK